MKTIVVGGGTAGIAAAHELKKRGIDYIVYEKNSAAGGRIRGTVRDNYILDLGAQFFFRFYDVTFQLASELGIDDQIKPFAFKGAIFKDDRFHAMVASFKPKVLWKARHDLMKFRAMPLKGMLKAPLVAKFFLERGHDLRFTDYERILDLDDSSLADYVTEKWGSDILEFGLQPVASTLTLGEPEDIGAGYGLALAYYIIFGLWTFNHGIGYLAEKIHEECDENILLGKEVEKIVLEDGKVRGVVVDGQFQEADAVISAVTASTLRELLDPMPEAYRNLIDRVKYSECCHVMFGLRNRLFKDTYGVSLPRSTGKNMVGFTESAVKSPYYAPTGAGLLHCFTYSRYASELNRESDERIRNVLMEELKTIVPEFNEEPLFMEIYRWKEAVCLSTPGMLKAASEFKKHCERAVKGLALAGEYRYMPSVEGALKSGIDAVQTVTG